MCLEPKDGEYDEASVDRGEEICHTDKYRVEVAVIVEATIWSQCYQRTTCQTEGVENLKEIISN